MRLPLLLGLMFLSLMGPPTMAKQCARSTLIAEVTHVRDGDTIEVGGLPIRLQGLAAPEGNEQGGTEATKMMSQMVLGRELRCELDGERTRDRCVGICYLAGDDIAAIMVRRPRLRVVQRRPVSRRGTTSCRRGRNHPHELPAAGVLHTKVTSSRSGRLRKRPGTS